MFRNILGLNHQDQHVHQSENTTQAKVQLMLASSQRHVEQQLFPNLILTFTLLPFHCNGFERLCNVQIYFN